MEHFYAHWWILETETEDATEKRKSPPYLFSLQWKPIFVRLLLRIFPSLNIIMFTPLRVCNSVPFSISRAVQFLPQSNVRTFTTGQKETPSLRAVPPTSPWQPMTYFLLLWISLFWMFQINGIKLWVFVTDFFCLASFPGFIHGQHVPEPHSFFLGEWYSIVHVLQVTCAFISWWKFKFFPHFGYYE